MHDLNETNPGLTLFSAELPWCCFCAEIKVLGMERNFARNFYKIKEDFGAKTHQRGAPGWAQPTRARPPLLARPGGLYPLGGPADDPPDTINSHYSKKIRKKELSRFTRRSRRQALFFLGRADLESVWGSREGDLRSSSSPTHLHRQFHDAPHRE